MPPPDPAEHAYLGAILIGNPATQTHLIPLVTAADFYDQRNADLWEILADMHTYRAPIDVITVAAWITDRGLLPAPQRRRIGSTLHTIAANPLTATNGEWYAQLIRDHAARRTVQAVGTRLAGAWVADDLDTIRTYLIDQLCDALRAIEHAQPTTP
jgi:replicative DNA helicase